MSGASRYRYLFSPLRIGPVVVRNRIVFSAHLTNYAEDGLPTQQHADYYAARAAGGVGLIITEEHSTHPTDWPYEKLIHGFHRAVIPGYQKMTAAAHDHGVPIFAQLNHNGGQASSMFSRLPVWAPSPVPDPMFREVPKAVERHEIAADRGRLRPGRRALRRRRLRRRGAAMLALLHRAGVPVARDEHAHRRVRRLASGPGPHPAGNHRRGAGGDRARPCAGRADLRRRADRGRQHARRGGRGGQDGGGHRPGRLHQHLDRRGHRDAVHDRGVDDHPARLRPVHLQRDAPGGPSAGHRGGPDQGPGPGRARAG